MPDTVGPEAPEPDPDSAVDAIRELLAEGARMQAGDIARTLTRFKTDTVGRTLRRMITNGEVVKDEGGWYMAVKMPLKFRTAPGTSKGQVND